MTRVGRHAAQQISVRSSARLRVMWLAPVIAAGAVAALAVAVASLRVPVDAPSHQTVAGPPTSRPVFSAAPRPVSPTPAPAPTGLRLAGGGPLVEVPGRGPVLGSGPRRMTFSVVVERDLQADGKAFAAEVEQILRDPRSWIGEGRRSLQRVPGHEADFQIVLASPRRTDALCRPLTTDGVQSCFNGRQAVLNAMRWQRGAATYGKDLANYRRYLVNHEVGHALDHRHRRCEVPGAPAPVMVQQTISTQGCRPNPWPLASPAT